MTQKPLAGLRDDIYDAIAEGRHTLKVARASLSEDAAEFEVAFRIKVDRQAYALLAATADNQKRRWRPGSSTPSPRSARMERRRMPDRQEGRSQPFRQMADQIKAMMSGPALNHNASRFFRRSPWHDPAAGNSSIMRAVCQLGIDARSEPKSPGSTSVPRRFRLIGPPCK